MSIRRTAMFAVLGIAIVALTGISQDGVTEATVLEVRDGDTIEVRLDGEREAIRFAGPDAPESGMCYAEEAKAFTQDQLGDTVWLDLTGRNNGRLVARPYLDPNRNQDLSRMLVRQGYAVTLTPTYEEAHTQARNENAGLWGACFVPGHKLIIQFINYWENPDEFAVIENRSYEDVDLGGYTLYSSPWGNDTQRCPLPAVTLEPGKQIEIHSGPDATENVCHSDQIWLDDGDTAWLVNEEGRFVDMLEYNGGYRSY